MSNTAVIVLCVWLLTCATQFLKHPADEAAIRSFIIGVAYVLSYVAIAGLVGLARRLVQRVWNRK